MMDERQSAALMQWLTTLPDSRIVERNPQNKLDYITWSAKWAMIRGFFPTASLRITGRWETEQGYHMTVVIAHEGVEIEGLGFEPLKSEKQVAAYSDSGYKSAYSDAVSNACARFGFGLTLYMDDPIRRAVAYLLTGEEPLAGEQRRSQTPVPTEAPGDTDLGRWIESKYDGKCSECGHEYAKGARILYRRPDHEGQKAHIRCEECGTRAERGESPVEPGDDDVPFRGPDDAPRRVDVESPLDMAKVVMVWKAQAGDKYPDMAHQSTNQLIAAIKESELALHERAIAGYEDKALLRVRRTQFLGSPALDGKEDAALRGYAAWLRHLTTGGQ